jgi:IS30 family transposase
VSNQPLARVVAARLKRQWSPEQISGWLKHAYAVNKDYLVSHETIYRSLYIQARGALNVGERLNLTHCFHLNLTHPETA